MPDSATLGHVPRSVLVTGGAGFIGCNFVRWVLTHDPRVRVAVLDSLTYAGSMSNLAGLDGTYGDRYAFHLADLRDLDSVRRALRVSAPDTIVHFAAESHVDRSIDGPLAFVETNVTGTAHLLTAARELWTAGGPFRGDVRFHHVSTDEVYGSLGETGAFTEDTPYDPSSPYSATKAASDHLVRAWHRTFGMPVTVTNCSNNYGPRQFPEKMIPLMLIRALDGQPLPLYGDGLQVRDWLHVDDHAAAVWRVVTRGAAGRTYNVGGRNEWANRDVVRLLCGLLERERPAASNPAFQKTCPGGGYPDLVRHVPDRPGHDRRYAIDATRIEAELGFRPSYRFEEGLAETVRWYLGHPEWIEAIRREKYAGGRLGSPLAPP